MEDSTSIEDEVHEVKKHDRKCGGLGWPRLLLLFVLFMVVCSDYFVNTVLSSVPGATMGRDPTNKGVIVQGLALVVGYVVVINMAQGNIL